MSFRAKHPLLGKFSALLINNNIIHIPLLFLVSAPAFTYLFLDYITYLFLI